MDFCYSLQLMNRHSNSVQSARFAVLSMFFINGTLFANWVSRIPQIQAHLSLSERELGFALMAMAVGVIVALSVAGGFIARLGSRVVTTIGAGLLALLLVPLGLGLSFVALSVNLFCFGAAMSLMDVAMNAQGVDVEQALGRPVMSSFHAAFSIGGFVGASIGGVMAWLDIGPLLHFLMVSVIFLGLIALAAGRLLSEPPQAQPDRSSGPIFQLPPRVLWPLGAVAFCTAIGEGTMADWSGVYLVEIVGATAGTAAIGFAAFSLTMTIGRLLGDWLSHRFTPAQIVRWGGTLALFGLLLALSWSQIVPVIVGFGIVGLGLSIIIPLTFSVAGNLPNILADTGIAGVATIGYAGFLAGPPIIGLLADWTSLRVAFILVMVLVGSLWFSSQALRPPTTARAVKF